MTDPDWWRGAVIYHIYPRSFLDTNSDGIGDLNGITRRLDYVAALGVDAIWLSPFFVSPMKDFGYDVADHCAVDPTFGSLADFDRLVARAHDLGLKVLIDQVWSHTSDQHAWFRESRTDRRGSKADWYVWADPRPDGTAPNNWLSVFGGPAWTWEPRRRQYYLHHFLTSQPQLNLRNPEVAEAVLAGGAFWLERGVDGFRLDAIDFLMHDPLLRDNPPRPPENGAIPAKPFSLQHHVYDMLHPDILPFLAEIRRLMDRFPGTTTLAEVSSQDGAFERLGLYTAPGRLHMAYTLRPLRGDFGLERLGEAIGAISAGEGAGCACWSFSNHDVERAITRWNPLGRAVAPSPAFARQLMALQLSLRGSVTLFQGEELGLTQAELPRHQLKDPFGINFFPEFRGRDGSRTPMPWRAGARHAGFSAAEETWLPVPKDHLPLSVDRQTDDPDSLLSAWRRFLSWRKTQPALVRGRIVPLGVPQPLLAFERASEEQAILVVFNLSSAPIRVPLQGAMLEPLLGHGFACEFANDVLSLPAHGVFFGRRAAVSARRRRKALETVG